MSEENQYTTISDVVNETDHYNDDENTLLQEFDAEAANTIEDSIMMEEEDQIPVETNVQSNKSEVIRMTKLPLARIKNIMKMDPDVHLVNSEAVFLVAKATEMFLETIAKETYTITASKKKKTIAKKDLDTTISMIDCLCFLEGAMDF